jgi:hypothetical protein
MLQRRDPQWREVKQTTRLGELAVSTISIYKD